MILNFEITVWAVDGFETVQFVGTANAYTGTTCSRGDDPDGFDIQTLEVRLDSAHDTYDLIGYVEDSLIERLIVAHNRKPNSEVYACANEGDFSPAQWAAITEAASECAEIYA